MKKGIFAGIIFLSFSFLSPAWATLQPSNISAAQTVIENWFAAMKTNQVDQAASFLAPQFVSLHTDGIVRNKTGEVALIRNLHMKNYHLTNFKFSTSGDIIIVTYQDKGSEQIDNQSIDSKPAGRMAVLQKQGNQWLIVAYANLDQIK